MKRRKVTYPVAKTHTKGAPRPGAGGDIVMVRPNLASFDVTAIAGRAGLKVGAKVRINGTGPYAGEEATIVQLIAGVIPAVGVHQEPARQRSRCGARLAGRHDRGG